MIRDYCGNYTYRNGAIERIMMGSGFLQDSVYYVQIKDYQGNVRAVLEQHLPEHPTARACSGIRELQECSRMEELRKY